MARVNIGQPTLAQLRQSVEPKTDPGGNMESYHHVLYDTQTYLAAGTTTLLNFFQTTSQDRTLSNMEQAGTLPDPKFLTLWFVSVDILIPPSLAAPPIAWQDMATILWTGRPIIRLVISDKEYGPVPLSFCHASGGVTGFGVSLADATATGLAYANNGVQDGGFYVGGGIIIPPKVGFNVEVRWGNPAAVDADTLVRVNLDGVMHRRIL